MEVNTKIIIIGAGLTGLTLASELNRLNIPCIVLEARDRIGGRILTKNDGVHPPMEMGATWLGKKHSALIDLLAKLDVGIFEQKLGQSAIYESISTSPAQLVKLGKNEAPSYRIKGGSESLIKALVASLSKDQIKLGEVVKAVRLENDKLYVETSKSVFVAEKVVSTLPPFLLTEQISFQPKLDNEIVEVSKQTHTWMGESIKVALSFKIPFWDDINLSGTIISNVGPIPEMYDHSDFENKRFALMGFLNGAYFSLSKDERLLMILTQLEKYYGSQVHDYLTYEEVVWRQEEFTFKDYVSHVLPHQNNGHQVFDLPQLDERFFISGTETSSSFPGYMEGAVRSALSTLKKLL
jgi:monoamine oxidase